MPFRYIPLCILLLTACQNTETKRKQVIQLKSEREDSLSYQQLLSSLIARDYTLKSSILQAPKKSNKSKIISFKPSAQTYIIIGEVLHGHGITTEQQSLPRAEKLPVVIL
jgi:hypothetical protein